MARIRKRGRTDRQRRRYGQSQLLWCLCFALIALAALVGSMYIRMVLQIVMFHHQSHNSDDEHETAAKPHLRANILQQQQQQQQQHERSGGAFSKVNPNVSYQIHAFYYPWYCNPTVDGRYMHWNHKLIEHWDASVAARYPKGQHDPDEDDIGASFYPQLGTYSSADPTILRRHMHMLETAGVGVAVVSWLPEAKHDDNGPPIAARLGPILKVALEFGIRIAIHMEPYENRTLSSLRQDIAELLDAHGHAPALHRLPRPSFTTKKKQPLLPVLYFYDQYRLPASTWKSLLAEDEPYALRRTTTTTDRNKYSIRNTPHDVVALALLVDEVHWNDYVLHANFDGAYTYFAANTFTYGSRPQHWKTLQQRAVQHRKLFVPSVGPGYNDERVRPWNRANTKGRQGGIYFDEEWRAALACNASIVSITSFNEWHEGTQIEPAVPKRSRAGHVYLDYEAEGGPESYLERNKKWAKRFQAKQKEE